MISYRTSTIIDKLQSFFFKIVAVHLIKETIIWIMRFLERWDSLHRFIITDVIVNKVYRKGYHFFRLFIESCPIVVILCSINRKPFFIFFYRWNICFDFVAHSRQSMHLITLSKHFFTTDLPDITHLETLAHLIPFLCRQFFQPSKLILYHIPKGRFLTTVEIINVSYKIPPGSGE